MEIEKSYDLAYGELLSGKENMEKDWENLLEGERFGRSHFRIYRWREPTMSIGYSQESLYFNIPVVKRPTGGGALVHGWDISFSYTGQREAWGGSFTKIYKNFMGLVLDALRELEPSFDMSKYRGGYEDYFCYFYPTLGEITLKGKKVLACAMRVMKRSFLIHGSLFMCMDYEYFERLTGIDKSKLKERIVTFGEMGIEEEGAIGSLNKIRAQLNLP